MICLNCRYVSPSGSSFCVRCGASLGAKLCPKKHVSPLEAEYCGVCGSSKLSKPARCVPLGVISRAVAWIAVGIALLVAFAHIGQIVTAACCLALRLASFLLCQLFCRLHGLIVLLLVVYFASHLFPEAYGNRIRQGLAALVHASWRLAVWGLFALVTGARLVCVLINGRKPHPGKEKTDRG